MQSAARRPLTCQTHLSSPATAHLRPRTAAGELVPLTGEDAHAWVEIYLDGMGWVPVDVTPGFYLDAYMLRQLAEHPQQVQRTVSLSEDDARIRLTALTLLPGKA